MVGLVDGNNFFVSCERVFNPQLRRRAVAVLSNNDGCCVARSNELKAMGVAMGTPYFQLRHRETSGEIIFCSSNFELYGDMSSRMISVLRQDAVEVEQYSIDEAFIYPPSSVLNDLERYGKGLRSKVLRWVGIPCGVGFAETKTLAKIANHIGKKRSDGVYVMPRDNSFILDKLPVDEVWGVGRRLVVKLKAERIFTAKHLRDANDQILKSIGGVSLLRTAMELRGISCYEERDYEACPDSVSCSRSFGVPATELQEIEESIASFTSQAAEKLRRYSMLATGCNVYSQIFAEGGGGKCIAKTVVFPTLTDATNEMISAIHPHIASLFIPGMRYRKTGIVFFGLEKSDSHHQSDLFNFSSNPRQSSLYKAVDALNAKYGRGKVFSALEGIGERSWQMKREKLSKRATTRWDEIITVK